MVYENTCSGCKEVKPITYIIGLTFYCKQCQDKRFGTK